EIAHRLAAGQRPEEIRDVRGTAFVGTRAEAGWTEIDSTDIDTPGTVDAHPDPYSMTPERAAPRAAPPAAEPGVHIVRFARRVPRADRDKSYIRLPDYDAVRDDRVLYAHASRILHTEANP